MRNLSTRMKRSGGVVVSVATLLCVLSGCSPAVQQNITHTTGQLLPLSQGTKTSSGWSNLVSAVQRGEQATRYYLNMTVDVSNLTHDSTLTFYGAIDPPSRVALTMNLDGISSQYYQQGQSAFKRVNGKWTQATALTGLNVYQSYAPLIELAAQHHIPLYAFPKQYVVDEYCTVYEAEIPSKFVQDTALWPTTPASSTGNLFMAFYIGKSTGEIREVDVAAAGGAKGTGSLVTHVHAVLFDINSNIAKVQIPSTLVNQLSGQ